MCQPVPPVYGPCVLGIQMIAAYALILFHIWPSEFCNSFMGMDIFFVVSGFLIGDQLGQLSSYYRKTDQQLPESEPRTISSSVFVRLRSHYLDQLRHLYPSALYRILPIHLLVIFGSLLAGFAVFFDDGLQKLREDALWALGFGTNHQLSDADWTFDLIGIPQPRPLLHLWAIAVEVQFLLIFGPFLLLLFHLTSSPILITLITSVLIILPSFLFWLFATSKSMIMGWMFARAWQFLFGTIASFISSTIGKSADHTTKASRPSKFGIFASICHHFLFYFVSFCLALVFFLPSMFWPPFFQNKTLLSSSICVGTAFLLCFYVTVLKQRTSSPTALSQWVVRHFGHFPFVCFMLHQPMAVFIRAYLDVSLLDISDGILAICLISIGALFVQQIFDRIFGDQTDQKWPFSSLAYLAAMGYAACILIALAPNAIRFNQPKTEHKVPIYNVTQQRVQLAPLSIDSARLLMEQLQSEEHRSELIPLVKSTEKVKINEMLKNSFTFDHDVPGTASDLYVRINHFQEDNKHVQRIYEWRLKGNGTNGVLLFGNSHAQVVWREVESALKGNYSWFHVVAVPGCMPLFEHDWRTIYGVRCAKTVKGLLNMLEQTRPNMLFLIFKWYDELQSVQLENPIEGDTTLREMQYLSDKMQKFVSDRIFVSAPNLQFDAEISHQLAKRIWQNRPLDGLDKNYTKHLADNKWSYARLAHLKCAKCAVFDLADEFCEPEEGICHAYDPNVQLAYFSDVNHISFLGRLKARKLFAKMIDGSGGGQ